MLKYLDEIDDMGINYYFQFTLNNYEKEELEPNIPPLEKRIDTFKRLSNKIGPEKVIWRFDPLVITDLISIPHLLDRVGALMDTFAGYTEKLVFSYLYPTAHKKVERKLSKAGIKAKEFSDQEKAYIALQISKMANEYKLQAATCAEAKGLSQSGISPNKCIDDDLIRRLFRDDEQIFAYVNSGRKLKDKGQRPLCQCIPSIDIGLYNTCQHFCSYCYANDSEAAVQRKMGRLAESSELLQPDGNS